MKKQKSVDQPIFIAWRYNLTLVFIAILVLLLLWRVFDLAILNQHFLQQQGNDRTLRLVQSPAFRGMIMDRNGFPLAVSTTVYSLFANPKEFVPSKKFLELLSKTLKIPTHVIQKEITAYRSKNREFVYLKRGLTPELATQIRSLSIPGLYFHPEYKRYYPEGEVFSHVVGFTNIDDQGQEGLELGFDQWLSGEPGKKWVMKDRLGRTIIDIQSVREQKAGHDLMLSIDRRIQYLTYRALLAGVKENQATAGSAVVIDAKTGEVLAMVNQPSFNPNDRTSLLSKNIRNRAVTDTFEPGSTIKAFTVASALESRLYKPTSVVNTSPGWMRVDHNVVKDTRNNGALTLAQILQLSSNMGAAKIALSLPPTQLWDVLQRVGFGEITGISFPGEQSGSLHNPAGAFMLATLSYGYGLSVTTLQLARAYSILANDGLKLPLSLLKTDHLPPAEPVLSETVAREMRELLETVVAQGLGRKASVPGYRVGGKTGTAWLVGMEGYEKHHYNSSFVGLAPLSNPRLVVAVVIHDPQGKNYYGGALCGPIFSNIMEGALRILAIPPDL